MAEDKALTCKDCGQQFIFTVGEQEFYAQKGFDNEPVRCAPCRKIKKSQRASLENVRFRDRNSYSYGNNASRTGYDRERY